MPWTNPETFTAGQTLTAASMNAISGNLNVLPRVLDAGAITAGATIAIASASSYSLIEVSFIGRGTASAANEYPWLRLNGDSGANYDDAYTYNASASEHLAVTQMYLGLCPAATAPASYFASYRITLYGPGTTAAYKNVTGHYGWAQGTAAGNIFTGTTFGQWRSTAAITSLAIGINSGGYAPGSSYTIIGYPATA